MADGQGERPEWWLRGAFAPVYTEELAGELDVEGALPPALNGQYIRNGANPPTGQSGHWFMGDGMLHAVRLEGGRARAYRNRYVQTKQLLDPKPPTDFAAMMEKDRSVANTSVVRHAGRIFALEEGHFPYEVSPELETLGCVDFEGKLKTAFTAHPKICPETGEMMAFGYQMMPPFLTYHRLSADGRLVQSVDIPMGGPTMVHDFSVTRRHAIFLDLPIVFDMEAAMAGDMPFAWSESYQARMGVMPRDGDASMIRWFNVDPCYIFHVMNAYDEGDEVVLDASRYAKIWSKAGGFGDSAATLWRYRLNLKTGAVTETEIDGGGMEFPRVDERLIGLAHRYGYAVEQDVVDNKPAATSRLFKYDVKTGARQDAVFTAGTLLGEPVFAAAGPGEDEGYVMTFASLPGHQASELVVLDAQDFAKGPVARVKIPTRVPMGFHGGFFPD